VARPTRISARCWKLQVVVQRLGTLSDQEKTLHRSQKRHGAVMVAMSNQRPHIFPGKGADAATFRALVIRKILMARILHSEQVPLHQHWANISRSQLSRTVSDESNCLSVFPEHWTAQMIGEFVLGSPRAGILVNMFEQLWKEAVGVRPRQHEEMLAAIQSHDCEITGQHLLETLGVPPRPVQLMDMLMSNAVTASSSGCHDDYMSEERRAPPKQIR